MSTLPIQTGFWNDYTREGVHRWTLTLSTRWSGVLLAGLVTFIGIVGASFWSLLAFTLHQLRVKSGEEDGLYFQQQVVLRNPGSPLQAVSHFLKASWAWRAQQPRRLAPRRLKSRTFFVVLPPLLVFIAFTVAAIFTGDMTRPGYGSENLKIRPVNCGRVLVDGGTNEKLSTSSRVFSKYLQAARVYMRECYEATTASTACGVYPQKSLPFTQANVSCPFGKDSKGNSLCTVDSALNLDTGLLDTSIFFGINAPPENRILLRRSSTCSPINVTEYAKPRNRPLTDNYTTWDFYLGPYGDSFGSDPTAADHPNSTYTYDTIITKLQFPYRLHSFSDDVAWEPITPLIVPNASTTLLLLESNSMSYLLPVKDPWFSANLISPFVPSEPSSPSGTSYEADSYVSAMACIDQYQICNPATSPITCTILGRFLEVINGVAQLNLNQHQIAAAFVASTPIPTSTTFWVTSNLGIAPLLAQELVNIVTSGGLPENQWQLEFQSWFKTALAYMQASVLAFPAQPTDLGQLFEPVDSASEIDHDVCNKVRIKNNGAYQSFSTLGLIIIFVIGIPIIVCSLTAEGFVAAARMRRRKIQYRRLHDNETPDAFNKDDNVDGDVSYGGRCEDREIARVADGLLQMQRKLLTSAAPEAVWEARMQKVPITTDPAARFPVPRRVKAENNNKNTGGAEDGDVEDDYEYRREEGVTVQEVKPKTDDQYQELLSQQEQQQQEDAHRIELGRH